MGVKSRATPGGWGSAVIGELITLDGIFTDGDWVESKDQDPSGEVRLIQLADVGDGVYLNKSSRFLTHQKSRDLRCTLLNPGDVLIARMPEPLGRACVFPGDTKTSVTVVDVCIVRTGANGPDHRWLTWFINSPEFRSSVASRQSGSTRKRISRGNLATIPLPLPPLPEQHRIVAEIEKQFSRLDASVAALKRAQVNLKRYRSSVLKSACEGKLVPTEAQLAREEDRDYEPADRLLDRILVERRVRWASQPKRRGKYKEPVAPDTSALPELPEGWAWANLGSITEIQGGIQKQPKRVPRHHSFPFLRVANVLRGQLDLEEIHKIELFNGELDKLRLIAGDLLLVEGNGSPSQIGRMAIWNGGIDDCVHQNHIIRARAGNRISPKYIESYWNSPDGSSKVLNSASSTSGLYTLSVSKVSNIPVPLPPLAEQRRIVDEVERRLSIIEQAEAAVEASLKRAERLRQSILKQAFTGKLVPQDPNDEPASLLLERIRAERAERAEAEAAAKRKTSQTKRRRSKTARQSQLAIPERTQ